jgi:hypothetical protein
VGTKHPKSGRYTCGARIGIHYSRVRSISIAIFRDSKRLPDSNRACPLARGRNLGKSKARTNQSMSLLTGGVGSQTLDKQTEPVGQQVGKLLSASRQVQSCGDRDSGRHHSVPSMNVEALASNTITMVVLHSEVIGSDAREGIASRLESLDSKVRCVR